MPVDYFGDWNKKKTKNEKIIVNIAQTTSDRERTK